MTGCRAILALTCFLLRASTALAQGDKTSPVEPPLPTVSAVIGHPDTYTLSPDFVITDVPTTREYWWNISAVAAAPDGYPRQIYAVNNLFPGPMIEANEGDEIIVHIDNYLHIGMTIHWHGMFQNGSQWMDGVAGVSQCPIPPGGSFTYQFKVEGQYGSYWWHSHFANTLADGIMGGLVIHSTRDPLKRGEHFDQEMVVMVSDWMDVQSETIVHAMHTPQGYRGSPAPPQGNAILINGWGRTNCSNEDIPDRNRPCVLPPPPEIKLPAGKRVKLRILNNGAFAMTRISIDQHPFDVVEVDDTPIYGPEGIHEVQVSAGQRTSIIINTDQGKAGDAFFLRSNVVTACIGRGGIVQTGLAVIRYVDAEGKSPSTVIPDTKARDNLQGTATKCQDLDEEYTLVPREAHDAPKDVLQTHVLSSSLGVFTDINGHSLGNFGFNGVPFQAQIGYPLLAQLEDGLELNNSFVAHVVFDNYGAGDIIVNNLDTGISHPYHLHGRPFFIVSRGKGNLTAEQWEANGQPNLANPLRRDTIEIPGGHHAVLRWYTDLPGVWPLHCHIGWHLAEGKLAAIVVQPNKIKSFGRPDPWSGMCSAWGKGDIGPAKRDDADGRSQFEEDLGLPASKRLALEADGGALPRRSRR